jgi:NADPH:quinone reductase-like Zn-dependent oxidoreductase
MKAITYREYGKSDVLQFVEIPDPVPKDGEVLVEIIASSVNPIDINIRNGSLKAIAGKKFPRIPGADLAGKVIESKHPDFKPGDKVYGMNEPMAGGCNAEKIAIPGAYLAEKPNVLSYHTSAIMPLTGLTCIQAMIRKCAIKAGYDVLINGCTGGVGSMAVQIATAEQAMVSGVCSKKNEQLARNLGADHVVGYEHEDLYQLGKFDIIFDTVGTLQLNKVKKMLKAGGKYITTKVNLNIMLRAKLSGKINYIIVKPDHNDLILLTRMIEDKQIIPVIEKDYPLEFLARAHDFVERGHSRGKVIVQVKAQGKK